MCVCMCVCVRVYLCACVRACVRACVWAYDGCKRRAARTDAIKAGVMLLSVRALAARSTRTPCSHCFSHDEISPSRHASLHPKMPSLIASRTCSFWRDIGTLFLTFFLPRLPLFRRRRAPVLWADDTVVGAFVGVFAAMRLFRVSVDNWRRSPGERPKGKSGSFSVIIF